MLVFVASLEVDLNVSDKDMILRSFRGRGSEDQVHLRRESISRHCLNLVHSHHEPPRNECDKTLSAGRERRSSPISLSLVAI